MQIAFGTKTRLQATYLDSRDMCNVLDDDGNRANTHLAKSLARGFKLRRGNSKPAAGRNDHSGSVERLLAHTDETGIRKSTNDDNRGIEEKSKPLWRCATAQTEDGGYDAFGNGPQHGLWLLQEQVPGVRLRTGVGEAWDIVTNKHLDSDLDAAARKTELEHVEQVKVYTRVRREEVATC